MALFDPLEATVRTFNVGLMASLFVVACGVRTPMECPSGSEGCSCDPYGSCGPGAVCVNGLCEPSTAAGAGGQGTFGAGGVLGTGGTGQGGQRPTGGVLGSGGTGQGGQTRLPTGGVLGTGGTGQGGQRPTGGVFGTGGTGKGGQTPVASGGWPGRTGGNRAGNGGTGGLGSGGVAGSAGNSVSFVSGRAEGAMTGYGWVALGQPDSVSAPTCHGGTPVTSASDCPQYDWPTSAGLCLSGKIPAVSNPADYSSNWGIMVSAEVSAPAGGTLGRSFQSILFDISGSAPAGLRGVLHRKGDPSDVIYCALLTSGRALTFTSFATQCWDGSGTSLTLDDVPNIEWLGIQVPSGLSAVTVSNLCLMGLVFK